MCDSSVVLFNTAALRLSRLPFTATTTCQQREKQADTSRHWLHLCTHLILQICSCERERAHCLLGGHIWPENVDNECDGWMNVFKSVSIYYLFITLLSGGSCSLLVLWVGVMGGSHIFWRYIGKNVFGHLWGAEQAVTLTSTHKVDMVSALGKQLPIYTFGRRWATLAFIRSHCSHHFMSVSTIFTLFFSCLVFMNIWGKHLAL